jgi:hypothetical protein
MLGLMNGGLEVLEYFALAYFVLAFFGLKIR